MKYIPLLCLLLAAGSIAAAQQPVEWRPTIAEDNKAATWEDTYTFLSTRWLTADPTRRLKVDSERKRSMSLQSIGSVQWQQPKITFTNWIRDWTGTIERLTVDLARIDPLDIAVVPVHEAAGTTWSVILNGTSGASFASNEVATYKLHLEGKGVYFQDIPPEFKSIGVPCTFAGWVKSCGNTRGEVTKASVPFRDLDDAKRYSRAMLHDHSCVAA